MKKEMIYVVAALMISVVAVFNVITVLEANHVYDLTMTSIDALSENGDGETGATITNEEECHKKNGYWNTMLRSVDGKVETVTCDFEGKLVVLGVTLLDIKFKKGKPYQIAWERMSCENSVGNCCLSDQQGIRVKKI